MKNFPISKLMFIILLAANPLISHASTPIYFAKNHTSTTISGTLSPKQTAKTYTLSVKKGQFMQVELFPKKGTAEFANVGEVIAPSGKMQGDKGGVIYQACLPETGNYRLRIARNLMATQGGIAGYIVKITILPIGKSKTC